MVRSCIPINEVACLAGARAAAANLSTAMITNPAGTPIETIRNHPPYAIAPNNIASTKQTTLRNIIITPVLANSGLSP